MSKKKDEVLDAPGIEEAAQGSPEEIPESGFHDDELLDVPAPVELPPLPEGSPVEPIAGLAHYGFPATVGLRGNVEFAEEAFAPGSAWASRTPDAVIRQGCHQRLLRDGRMAIRPVYDPRLDDFVLEEYAS